MIGISSDKAFARLCDALGRPEWTDDLRFRTNLDRVRNTPELDRLISGVLGPVQLHIGRPFWITTTSPTIRCRTRSR